MGTFAETANDDYCLAFADQGKQTPFSVLICSCQTDVHRFRFPFSVSSVYTNILPFQTEDGKRLLRRFSFVICPFVDNETNRSFLFAND
jgi:hypothetical protein